MKKWLDRENLGVYLDLFSLIESVFAGEYFESVRKNNIKGDRKVAVILKKSHEILKKSQLDL